MWQKQEKGQIPGLDGSKVISQEQILSAFPFSKKSFKWKL